MPLSAWMSWEGGVDLVGATSPEAQQPNVIVHVARLVHTPAGSAPAGMLLYHPPPESPPVCAGFVSPDPVVGAYFGPNVFAGTPFEGLPVVTAEIEVYSRRLGIHQSYCTSSTPLRAQQCVGCSPHAPG